MFQIQNTRIQLTRGDSAAFTVEILRETADGQTEPYVIAEDDTLTLTVRRSPRDPHPTLTLQSAGSPVFALRPQDTKSMCGRYIYDIELRTAAGDVYTILGPGAALPTEMEILPEVTV